MNKYGNIRVGRYPSKKQADWAGKLHALNRAGKITELAEEVTYQLYPRTKNFPPISYRADFAFMENGKLVVMDAKGFPTRDYKIKKRLMWEIHRILVEEV